MTIRRLRTALLAIFIVAAPLTAHANTPDPNLILDKLAALEARVASLEDKNRQYKRELDQARARLRNDAPKTVRLANAAMPSKEPASPILAPHPQPGWTGFFWGAAAGGAATRSQTNSVERATNGPAGYNASDMSGPSSNSGGFIDLFAGGDLQVSRLVLGGQLEASIADLNFSSTGTRAYSYFDAGGPTGATATGDYRPQVTARWLASALLRAGVLLDDNTLLYGLGGWTFGRFEARNVTDNPFYQPNETFWANGPTGGVGLEHKLDSNWRVRAEYRYTRFDGARTQDQYAFTFGGATTQAYTRSTLYDQSMQSGRIGFAYAFNPLR
jgi:opacity protein-like surface antigen